MKTAIVIGGGLAGLTAAYRLKQAGWSVRLLEAAERSGGRVITIEKNGYLIDACAAGASTHYFDFIELIKDVGLAGKLVQASSMFGVVRDGKVHEVDVNRPVSSFIKTRYMSVSEKIRFVLGFLKLSRHNKGVKMSDPGAAIVLDDLTMQEVAARCFGEALLKTVMNPVMRMVTYGELEDTTAVELYVGLVSISGKYISLRGGLEVLPSALAKGLDIQLETSARSVTKCDEGVCVTYQHREGELQTETVDACVIATGFQQAAQICPQIAKEGERFLRQRAFTPGLVVHLGYSRRAASKMAALALPKSEFPWAVAILLEHNKVADRAPEGHSLFSVFCPTAVIAELGQLPDETLLARCRDLVEHFFPEVKGYLEMTNIKRAPLATHLAPPGYFGDLQQFMANHSDSDPIQLAGDYFALPSQETAVATGNRAAAQLIASATN